MRHLGGCTECFTVWWACRCPMRCEECGYGYREHSTCGTPGCVTGENRGRANSARFAAEAERYPIQCEPAEVPSSDPSPSGRASVQNERPAASKAARRSNPKATDHRPVAQRRADIIALLGDSLSDREIARRAGVSPSTVAAVRKERIGAGNSVH